VRFRPESSCAVGGVSIDGFEWLDACVLAFGFSAQQPARGIGGMEELGVGHICGRYPEWGRCGFLPWGESVRNIIDF